VMWPCGSSFRASGLSPRIRAPFLADLVRP
jgi:hypothetical protein